MKERKKEEAEGTLVKRSSSRSARGVVFPYYSLLSLLFLQGKTTHTTLQSLLLLLHLSPPPPFPPVPLPHFKFLPKETKTKKKQDGVHPTAPLPLLHLHARTQLCGCPRCSRALISLRRPTTDRRSLWTHTEKRQEKGNCSLKMIKKQEQEQGETSLLSVLFEEGGNSDHSVRSRFMSLAG